MEVQSPAQLTPPSRFSLGIKHNFFFFAFHQHISSVQPFSYVLTTPFPFASPLLLAQHWVSLDSHLVGWLENPDLLTWIVEVCSHPTLPSVAAFLFREDVIWDARDSINSSTKIFCNQRNPFVFFFLSFLENLPSANRSKPTYSESDYGYAKSEIKL